MTRVSPANIIPNVTLDGLLRRVTAAMAVLGLLGLAMLPVEHVHAEAAQDGHHGPVIHRHFATHHQAVDDALRFEEGDDEPIWLDTTFVVASVRLAPGPTPTGVVPGTQPLRSDTAGPWERSVVAAAPIHDPPLITSVGFRGPPASV